MLLYQQHLYQYLTTTECLNAALTAISPPTTIFLQEHLLCTRQLVLHGVAAVLAPVSGAAPQNSSCDILIRLKPHWLYSIAAVSSLALVGAAQNSCSSIAKNAAERRSCCSISINICFPTNTTVSIINAVLCPATVMLSVISIVPSPATVATALSNSLFLTAFTMTSPMLLFAAHRICSVLRCTVHCSFQPTSN